MGSGLAGIKRAAILHDLLSTLRRVLRHGIGSVVECHQIAALDIFVEEQADRLRLAPEASRRCGEITRGGCLRHQCAGALRAWAHFECRLHDHSQGSQGTHMELRQVVAGDILDHLATAFYKAPLRIDHTNTNQPVARRSVAQLKEPGGIGC